MESGIGGQLRSVVSLIDRLRDIQLEQYIKLPKIVVVGSQSSGKSSLIEQIVGLDFLPRGSGVVTRRPLEIRMTYHQQTLKPIASFQEIPDKTFTDFTLVKSSIEELTDKVCGKKKNIVDKPIILKVQSNSCPNLTVIDLPGLTRIALDGQDSNIYKVTQDMIKRYITDPSTIVLSVIPANQDITNDQVLDMAMKIDTLGERTLACVTKIDIMDRGTDARNLLLNKGEVPLKLGYVGIKNRSQDDIQKGMTVADSLKEEKMFFSTSAIYSSLPPSCLGTSALVNSLTRVLESNITQFLPELLQQVKQRKNALQERIKEYGKPLPKTETEEQALIWSISSQFLAEFKKSIKGHLTALKIKEQISKTSQHLNHIFQVVLEQQFNNEPEDITNKKVLFAMTKFEGGSLPGFPSIHSFYYLVDPLLKRLRLPLQSSLSELCQTILGLVGDILGELCRDFPFYKDYLYDQVAKLIGSAQEKCSTFIDQVIEAEVNYIYTNNSDFFNSLEKPCKKEDLEDPIVVKHPIVAVLKKRVIAYFKVVVKTLREMVPKNMKRTVLESAVKDIQFQIFQASHSGPSQAKQWLKQTTSNYQERVNHQKQYQTITKAEQYLLTHPAFSRIRVQDVKKRRAERQKQIRQIQQKQAIKRKQKQLLEESPISKQDTAEVPKDSAKKPHNQTQGSTEPSVRASEKASLFNNIFGAKKQEPKKEEKPQRVQRPIERVTTPTNQANKQKKPDRAGLFGTFFGPDKEMPKQDISKKEQPVGLKDQYNKKAGEASEKAVDNMFKNETFQKQSKRAVEQGASSAAQQQLGVSQKTANTMGKGMGWLFGQETTQNYLKDQTKNNLKNQVQMKK